MVVPAPAVSAIRSTRKGCVEAAPVLFVVGTGRSVGTRTVKRCDAFARTSPGWIVT